MVFKDVAVSSLGVPMRKRTVKACDQCRRRKTKCDGLLSCSTCSGIGLECSYGNRIKQARGPRYVVQLEQRLQQYENKDHVRKASSASSESSQSSPNQSQPSLNGSFDAVASSRPSSFESSNVPTFYGNRTSVDILGNAKALLESLGSSNPTAARCLESLNPLYESASQPAHQSYVNIPDLGYQDTYTPGMGLDFDTLNAGFTTAGQMPGLTSSMGPSGMFDWNFQGDYHVPPPAQF